MSYHESDAHGHELELKDIRLFAWIKVGLLAAVKLEIL
jgi:hypothetical protein